jgi:hypothetical protein
MSRLSRWIVDGVVALALGYVIKQFIFPLTKALAVHAMLGWIDDKIGEVLGITGQTAINWAFAFGLATLILWLYHIIQVWIFRAPMHSASGTAVGLQSTSQSYRPTKDELPPQFNRWRWWYRIWAGAPFHMYAARKRLEFMDSWREFHAQQSRASVAPKSENRQSGITQIAVGKVLPPARYSRAQINRILEAIDAIYPILTDIEQVLVSGTWTAGSLEANIRDRGRQFVLGEMDQLRLKVIGPAERLDKVAAQYSLYREACQPIADRESFKDAFFESYNELVGVLREIPDQITATALAIFVDAKKQTFITRIAEYLSWAQRKKKALSEYREYYLRHETTD